MNRFPQTFIDRITVLKPVCLERISSAESILKQFKDKTVTKELTETRTKLWVREQLNYIQMEKLELLILDSLTKNNSSPLFQKILNKFQVILGDILEIFEQKVENEYIDENDYLKACEYTKKRYKKIETICEIGNKIFID